MKERPSIHCSQCDGSGLHPLRSRMWATLQLLTDQWQTMDALMRSHRRIGRTTLCNRLVELERLGLAERCDADAGRGYDWRKKS